MTEFKLAANMILRTITRDLANYEANHAIKVTRQEYKRAGAKPSAAGGYHGTVVLKAHLYGARNEIDVLAAMLSSIPTTSPFQRQHQDG